MTAAWTSQQTTRHWRAALAALILSISVVASGLGSLRVPQPSVRVIVRALPGAEARAREAVEQVGGTVGRAFRIIHAFTARIPADRIAGVRGAPGVQAVEVNGHRVHCHVTGAIEPLLEALTAVGVLHLVSREPSLEELFLSHYGLRGDDAP